MSLMKTRVDILPATLKRLHTLGPAVATSLLKWTADVQDLGLATAQKIPAHEDRATFGKPGERSVKLTDDRVVAGVVVIHEINRLGSN